MEDKVKLLIAVGASLTANCHACLKTAVTQAEKAGVSKKEIFEALAIGRVVRKGALGKMDKFASNLAEEDLSKTADDCPFGSTEEDIKEWVNQDEKCDCAE